MEKTQKIIKAKDLSPSEMKEKLAVIVTALEQKGYNPVAQLAGWLLSDDPTYITNHNGARNIVSSYDRFDVLELILKDYLS